MPDTQTISPKHSPASVLFLVLWNPTMFIAPLASSFVSPPAAAVFGSPRAGQPRHRERTSVGFHRLRGPAPFNTLSMGVDDASTAAPLPIVRSGYGIFGALSCISWYICADFSLATHATLQLPWIHNAVCIGQALTQLPLLIAFCAILAEAGQKGWVQLARLQVSPRRSISQTNDRR